MSLPRAILRSTPEDFRVEEIPAYQPSGAGEHLYVTFEKRGLDTLAAVRKLASQLGVNARDVGTAGLKDRHAVTTQTASFPYPLARGTPEASSLDSDGIRVLSVARHGNKLRTGHLHGNRFVLVLRGMEDAEIEPVAEKLIALGETGLPNWFGAQRFGRAGDNVETALSWMKGETKPPRDPRIQRLHFSAVQSELFHRLLRRRVADGSWCRVLDGDLVAIRHTRSLFLCDDAKAEEARAAAGEVCATGPIFGAKMRWPSGSPGDWEREILDGFAGGADLLAKFARLGEGARRDLRLLPEEVRAERETEYPGSLRVQFVLPKGAYATSVLDAVCHVEDATRPPQRTASGNQLGDSAEEPAAEDNEESR